MSDYLLLALGALAWGVLHSVPLLPPVRSALARRLGDADRSFRLGYNLVALAGILGLFVAAYRIGGPVIFDWWGAAHEVGVVFLVAALLLFFAGARVYDMGIFLGVTQLDNGSSPALAPDGEFTRRGILRLIRHPWYTAILLVLWSGSMSAPDLILAIILSVYTLVGARMEERRMVRRIGDPYREYLAEVSGYLPWKWVHTAYRQLTGKGRAGVR
jgi:protein-S-isoprenylcysteine O-methyltransferase Ste14